MEGFDLSLGKGRKPLFDAAPGCFRRRISGVDYLHLKGLLLYRWMDGIDLEQAHGAGLVSKSQMIEWTRRAADQLLDFGWMVLDHKPRHLIVRPKRDRRTILQRRDQPVLGLVDYELLVPSLRC